MNYALFYSRKRSDAKELPFCIQLSLFLGRRKGLYLASLAVATVALWGLRPPAARNCFPKSCEQNAKQSGTTYGLFVATNKAKSRAPFSFASALPRNCKADPLPSAPQLRALRGRNPTYPTARERWRHSFANAKRRGFKFSIFKVRVSVSKI